MLKSCTTCGTSAIDDKSLFCNKCGSELPKNESSDVICPNCDAQIFVEDAIFCNECGAKLLPKEIKPTPTCPNCNTPVMDDQSLFCNKCGSSLSQQTKIESKSQTADYNEIIDKQVSKSEKSSNEKHYESNVLIVLLLIFGLFSIFISPILTIFIVVMSAIGIYLDAKSIGAGRRLRDENKFNNAVSKRNFFKTASWDPIQWAVWVLLLWIFSVPFYLIKRREIYFFNISDDSNISPTTRESIGIKKPIEHRDKTRYNSGFDYSMKKKKSSSFLGLALIGVGIVILVLIIAAIIAGIVFGVSNNVSSSKNPTLTVAEIRSQAQSIPFASLMRNPATYKNTIVTFRGKIVQVQNIYGDSYILRIATKNQEYLGYFDDVIYVDYTGERLLEGDIVDVWGKSVGLKSYAAVLGNEVTIPEINALHVEIVEAKT
jgi:Zn finger protein HypA/HybF involved in hydrogenase expression